MKALKVIGRGLLELLALAVFLLSAAVLILALIPTANAAGTTSTVTWTLPTARLDGTALPASAIKEISVIWRRPGSSVVSGTVTVAGAPTSTTVPNLVCGDWIFTVTVTAKVVTPPDSPTSAESAPSNLYATGIGCSCPAPASNVNAT